KKQEKIRAIKLSDITKRKNPYLFKAKGLTSASDLIKSIMDATVSSGEETVFGNFMEKIAIFTCSQAFGGRKSSAVGIDLEFETESTKYLIRGLMLSRTKTHVRREKSSEKSINGQWCPLSAICRLKTHRFRHIFHCPQYSDLSDKKSLTCETVPLSVKPQ
ncbi:PmeII family type II restriction endonuclease, partial [Klebsiella sp. K792]|uniref:PmeII family type II restriction endonuclease n=1 Tax=Klebsiella sp. K792 TaxID=3369401 RepID=UPI003C2F8905